VTLPQSGNPVPNSVLVKSCWSPHDPDTNKVREMRKGAGMAHDVRVVFVALAKR
jgi:hypothetical protein